jgi:hypothetical protein
VPPANTSGVMPASPAFVVPPAVGPPTVVLPAALPPAAVQASSMTYVGEGIAPVPKRVADRILRWDFVEMGELLPEFGLSTSTHPAGLASHGR